MYHNNLANKTNYIVNCILALGYEGSVRAGPVIIKVFFFEYINYEQIPQYIHFSCPVGTAGTPFHD